MKIKFLIACLLAVASFAASAADQTVLVTTTPTLDSDNHFIGTTAGADGLLSGGEDIITFVGIPVDHYSFVLTVSGINTVFDGLLSNLNGVAGLALNNGSYAFYGVSGLSESPLVLKLFGTASAGASYSGQIALTAMPEPSTYALMVIGLGVLLVAARRTRRQDAKRSSNVTFA